MPVFEASSLAQPNESHTETESGEIVGNTQNPNSSPSFKACSSPVDDAAEMTIDEFMEDDPQKEVDKSQVSLNCHVLTTQ